MEKRPRIKIPLSLLDKILEVLCLTILVAGWLFVLWAYPRLPDQIPTHFDAAGQANDFGPKATLFYLPAISLVLYAGITILNRFPHHFNYLTEITEQNAMQLYTSATRFIRWLKTMVLLIFAAIIFFTCQASLSSSHQLGAWFLPLAIVCVLAPTVGMVITQIRHRRPTPATR